MAVGMTYEELKKNTLEMWQYYFRRAKKLYSLPEEEQGKNEYEIGKAVGGEEACGAILLCLGVNLHEKWLEEISRNDEPLS